MTQQYGFWPLGYIHSNERIAVRKPMSKILQPYKRRYSFRGEHCISSLINFTQMCHWSSNKRSFFSFSQCYEKALGSSLSVKVVCFQLLVFLNLGRYFLPVLAGICEKMLYLYYPNILKDKIPWSYLRFFAFTILINGCEEDGLQIHIFAVALTLLKQTILRQ